MRVSLLHFATITILFVHSNSFQHGTVEISMFGQGRGAPLMKMAPKAGTFFNQVPENNKDEDDNSKGSTEPSNLPFDTDNTDDAVDESLKNLLKQRSSPSKASQPSTIKGIPSAEAGVGFGKVGAKPSAKPYFGVGPPDKPLNDINNPEYDDQGYTLYANEKTGEKSRVFEALVDYPCEFTMKIVGANEGAFVAEIVALVAECCEVEPKSINHSTRMQGKWVSVTVKAPVKDAEMLYTLYECVDRDPRVKFKF